MQDAVSPPARTPILLVIISALVALAVVNSGTTVSIWTALLLRPFMHGVSLFKIDFLLIFLLLSGITTLTGPLFARPRTIAIMLWTTISAVSLGSIIGLTSFFSLAARLHLPLSKYTYFFSSGYNSINQFAHLHITKTGLYHLLSFVGLGQIADRADTGRPFADYVNSSFSMVILLMAAIALVVLLLSSATIVRQWQGGRQATALLLYSLAGSHIVKCLIDGGPLTYDFLPSMMVVILLFLQARGQSIRTVLKRYWLILLLVFVLFLAIISAFSLDIALVVQPQQYGFFVGLYTCLVALLLGDFQRKFTFGLAVIPALVWCGLYYYSHTLPDIEALNARLSSAEQVFMHDATAPATGAASMTISNVSTPAIGQRVIDVYRQNNQNPLRNRMLMIKSADRSRFSGLICALRILKSDSVLKLNSTEYLTIRGLMPAGDVNDSLFVLRIEFNPEFFPPLWHDPSTIIDENNNFAMLYVLNDYFAVHGLRDYVLVPVYYEDAG